MPEAKLPLSKKIFRKITEVRKILKLSYEKSSPGVNWWQTKPQNCTEFLGGNKVQVNLLYYNIETKKDFYYQGIVL